MPIDAAAITRRSVRVSTSWVVMVVSSLGVALGFAPKTMVGTPIT
ncbi:hypothetical protein BVIET440_30385 [Burkholderia vietnamiensis]